MGRELTDSYLPFGAESRRAGIGPRAAVHAPIEECRFPPDAAKTCAASSHPERTFRPVAHSRPLAS